MSGVRHELKYIISPAEYTILTQRLLQIMSYDSHCSENGYIVSSLYFDNVYKDAYNQKMSGFQDREKYRIRIYDNSDQIIKLECKKKLSSYISKQSVSITKEQYCKILAGDISFMLTSDNALLRRFYLLANIKLLTPVVVVEYRRIVFADSHGTRISFDFNLNASTQEHNLFSNQNFFMNALSDVILEIKFSNFLPSHIYSVLAGLDIQRQRLSKYTICMDKLLEVKHYA